MVGNLRRLQAVMTMVPPSRVVEAVASLREPMIGRRHLRLAGSRVVVEQVQV